MTSLATQCGKNKNLLSFTLRRFVKSICSEDFEEEIVFTEFLTKKKNLESKISKFPHCVRLRFFSDVSKIDSSLQLGIQELVSVSVANFRKAQCGNLTIFLTLGFKLLKNGFLLYV